MAAPKRFEAILEKLFPNSPTTATGNRNRDSNASSASTTATTTTTSYVDGVQRVKGKRKLNGSSALDILGSKSRGNPPEDMRLSSSSSVSVQTPSCRPWDRDDLFRRLSTFRSMTWFAKPQAVSAVNCARRGWINVDMDIIACESCGARLLFSTPSSWTQQQVENAALVFSLKLDTGHKLLCPWVDNICDEKLAEFPPKPSAVLVDDYKKRCSALLQLSALPIISPLAIDYIRSPQLEEFLVGSSGVEKNISADASSSLINEPLSASSASYYQAQKLISLFGWELQSLPYFVDCKVGKEESSGSVNLVKRPYPASDKVLNLSVICSSAKGISEAANDSQASERVLYEPSSVVFKCRLCGASVGLWAFSSVPRPMEFLRLVVYTEVDGQNDMPQPNNSAPGSSSTSNDAHNDFAASTSSNENESTLSLTIAGGPPPAKQKYRATISLPLVGRNLRARFFPDSMVGKDQEMPLLEGNTLQEANNQVQGEPVSNNENQLQNIEVVGGGLGSSEIILKNVEKAVDSAVEDRNESQTREVSSCNVENNAGIIVETAACKSANLPGDRQSETAIDPGRQNGDSNVACRSLGGNPEEVSLHNSMEFDPIRQHRLFCPWTASSGTSTPGWKQTLSALQHHKEFSGSFPENPPSSLIKVDDPIASVRKLFSSPLAKKMKYAHAS